MIDVFSNFWPLVQSVLRLDTAAIAQFAEQPGSGQLALLVVLVVGVSEGLGNSLVLFINRVRPARFVLTLVVYSIILAVTYGFLTLSIFAVARLAFAAQADYALVAQIVAFGYAPRIFGLFEFIPVLGRPIALTLDIWSLLAVLAGVAVGLDLLPWQALITIALGSVAFLTLQRTVGRPLLLLGRWLQRRASGVQLVLDRDGLKQIIRDGRQQDD